MAKVLVVGAGGVGSVAVHKMAGLPEIFSHIILASRTKAKCDAIAASVKQRLGASAPEIETAALDADDTAQTIELIEKTKPALLVNLALPYQDLTLMEACLATGIHYLDTANYEPRDEAKFEYHWQWAYQERFAKAKLTALLGCGFDPGVTNIFVAHINKHLLDEMHALDILDCNDGTHGQAFATNFNPEINIREVTAAARHWEKKGEKNNWIETPALSHKQNFAFPEIGERDIYLMYHEELESLTKNFPSLARARFWMTFSDSYLQHLRVLENIGMTSIKPVPYEGRDIIPLQFLKAVLPEPSSLGASTKGKTCIGVVVTGIKDGQEKTFYIYNICDHESCFAETGGQAVSYTTGVPAMIGAALLLQGTWSKKGVVNVEELNPDPFMDMLNQHGLAWSVATRPAPLEF